MLTPCEMMTIVEAIEKIDQKQIFAEFIKNEKWHHQSISFVKETYLRKIQDYSMFLTLETNKSF